jgi:hypothetical protein
LEAAKKIKANPQAMVTDPKMMKGNFQAGRATLINPIP